MSKQITRKQKLFVSRYLETGNATKAVLFAYNTTKPNAAKVIGSKLLTNANVRGAIEEALGSNGLDVSTLIGNLGKIASSNPERISADVKFKALIELLKLHGVYANKHELRVGLSFTKSVKEMGYYEAKDQLKKLETEAQVFINDVS